MNPVIRTGIIGLGRSGWQIHAACLAQHSRYRVVAVADPEPDRVQEAADRFGWATYRDCRSLLDRGDLDLAVVATPNWTHKEVAMEALRAGCDVVVEKPFAPSLQEAREVVAEADRLGRRLTVFHNRRFDADFVCVRSTLDQGLVGPPRFIRMGRYWFWRRNDWQTLRRYGGGILNNWGVHLIDQALQLMKAPARVEFADMRHLVSAGDAEDHAKVILRDDDGLVVDIEVTYACAAPVEQWLVIGDGGALWGTERELHLKRYDPTSLPALEAVEASAPGRGGYGPPQTIAWTEQSFVLQQTDTARVFYDALYEAIRGHGPLPVSPASVLEQLRIVEEVRLMALRARSTT